jgi:hypothetical protein
LLPYETSLKAQYAEEIGIFFLSAEGNPVLIAEIAQQFAWLSGALRSSPLESELAFFVPVMQRVGLEFLSPDQVMFKSMLSEHLLFQIGFESHHLPSATKLERPGHCWHNKFRNPMVVQGYPIQLKRQRNLGLEMPLNMMAGLLYTDRAIEFDSKVFIKGFSDMLVATRVVDDILVWHTCTTNPVKKYHT